jgi:hypothetical protein
MANGKSRHDGFLGICDAWTEQHRIFRLILSLKLHVLQEPLFSASLVPVDGILMLHV